MKEVGKLPHLITNSTGNLVPTLVVEPTVDDLHSILNNYSGFLNMVPARLNQDGIGFELGATKSLARLA